MGTLNEQQLRAATSDSKRILCLAGAGTGKTRTLTARIKNLTDQRVGASAMVALTFTRMAGMEMKQRIIAQVGEATGSGIFCNTFHAFCLSLLKQYPNQAGLYMGFTIYDDIDREAVFTKIIGDYMLQVPVQAAMDLFTKNRETGTFYKDPAKQNRAQRDYLSLIHAYRDAMRDNNAIDLSQIINRAVTLLQLYPEVASEVQRRYTHVFVDEYQDTSPAQARLLELMDPENLFIVGDDYQAIYEWRDARPDMIINLANAPGWEVIRLEVNYRSTGQILDIANAVIKQNRNRTEKNLVPATVDKGRIAVETAADAAQEADSMLERLQEAPERITAILCRTNKQVVTIAEYLATKGIRAGVITSYNDPLRQPHIKQLLQLLQLSINGRDSHSLDNTIFRFGDITIAQYTDARLEARKREITTLEVLRERRQALLFIDIIDELAKQETAADVFNRLLDITTIIEENEEAGLLNRNQNIYDTLYLVNKWEQQQRRLCESITLEAFMQYVYIRDIQAKLTEGIDEPIKIMTVHTAKGLEFERVFIPQVNRGLFPSQRSDIEEERRLFFVAVTRAEKELYISGTMEQTSWTGRPVLSRPSELHMTARQALIASNIT